MLTITVIVVNSFVARLETRVSNSALNFLSMSVFLANIPACWHVQIDFDLSAFVANFLASVIMFTAQFLFSSF